MTLTNNFKVGGQRTTCIHPQGRRKGKLGLHHQCYGAKGTDIMRSVGSLGGKPAGEWKRLVPLKATGRVGGHAWKESAESDQKESGAKASTSKRKDDQYGDADEQYWQDKTDEEKDLFEQRQITAAQVTGSEVEQLRFQAQARSWEVLGGLCVAVAMGASGYSLWERAEYERALQVRQAEKISATTGVAKPMPQAPRDWSPWQVMCPRFSLLSISRETASVGPRGHLSACFQ
jgi:hypothetical protein